MPSMRRAPPRCCPLRSGRPSEPSGRLDALPDEDQGRARQHRQAAEHIKIAFEQPDESRRMARPKEGDAPGVDRRGRRGGQAAGG
jgi:hypothetical protein